VPRWRLFVFKYFGGLTFVALNALVLVGGTWLGISIGTGFVQWGYLLTGVTLVLLFAIVYSVSALAAVLFRSYVLSIVLSIVLPVGFWFLCSLVTQVRHALHHPLVNARVPIPQAVKSILTVIYYILPATSDLGQLNVYFMTLGEDRGSMLAGMGASVENIDFTGSILSSLVFAAVVVAVSAYLFHRKDY
jgi:ABC-type transport system involved in multi-copper enzyme maturation permease subunit